MANRFQGSARGLIGTFVAVSALAALGWLWWGAVHRSDVNFLPAMAPAQWIVYPAAPSGVLRMRAELPAVFRTSMDLTAPPRRADLRVAGFHRYSISINGATPGVVPATGRIWKQPDRYEVSNLLRTGRNEIEVTVFNSNGPPALWLALDAGAVKLTSGQDWTCSYAGAVVRKAALASRPKDTPPGNPLYGGTKPGEALARRWPLLLAFTCLSAAAYWLMARVIGVPRPSSENADSRGPGHPSRRVLGFWRTDGLIILGLAAAWIAFFANNLGILPNLSGFDATGHMQYVSYVLTRHALPTASEGWEMFQPPLYYILSACWIGLIGFATSPSEQVLALRVLGLGIGLGHLAIVWMSLRTLFPGRAVAQRWGLLLAGCLPPMLYLSQYVTNEALAAALVSLGVYFTLRLVQMPRVSWQWCAALGACLGLALLTKATALLALPPIIAVLGWKWIVSTPAGEIEPALSHREASSSWRSVSGILLILTVCVTVCGWHYAGVWRRYGTPFIGVWDPRTGFSWWQDEGYRTSSSYLRFGQALTQPWFSALHGFWNGIYVTLWGDGLLGGAADHLVCPPWNYDLMAIAYWLALAPTLVLMVGGLAAIRGLFCKPSLEWFLLLGLGFLIAFAVVLMSLTTPYYCTVKAFYGLSALVPLCAVGAWGMDALCRGSRLRSSLGGAVLGVWAITSFTSFWISRDASATPLIQARCLLVEGRAGEAEAAMRARLARVPGDDDARELLATILGNTEEASELAAAAVTGHPDEASKHLVLARTLELRRPAEAIEHARRALELAPGYPPAFSTLTALLLQEHDFAEAERTAREGLANDPLSQKMHLALATALAQTGQIEEGVAQLGMVAPLQPANPRIQCEIASLYELMGQTTQAVACYSEALRLDPSFSAALNNLAWIRATHPDAQFRDGMEAVILAERACERTSYQEPVFVGTLAAAYAAAGRFGEAVTTAGKARDLAAAAGQNDLAGKNEQLIDSFRAGKAWRDVKKELKR